MTATLRLRGHAKGGVEDATVEIRDLAIAGWTGRDRSAVEHHIEELAALGVARPSSTPIFYRVAAANLTQAGRIQALGGDSSGEVEPVLVAAADRLWVTVGADHTDRRAESWSVAASKQMCAKPVAGEAWRFEEVEPHWDRLELRSWIVENGVRTLYQEGAVAAIRPPRELVALWRGGERRLPAGTAMFCGTLGALGGVRPAPRFEMELRDPVLGRAIAHAYDIEILPSVA